MNSKSAIRILVMHCHTNNRGDEAAVHALVDELNLCFDNLEIVLAMRGNTQYPNLPVNVRSIRQYMPRNLRSVIFTKLAELSKGKLLASGRIKQFVHEIKSADIVLHAPGGPSIGDTYYEMEPTYLRTYGLVRTLGKRYMFYAPSMGPFKRADRNEWRKSILNSASAIVLRDPISAEYVKGLLPNRKIYQTLDSSIQHDIDMNENTKKLELYKELTCFLSNNKQCVGVTITNLLWHPVHSKDPKTAQNIENCFREFLGELIEMGYSVIFIPQLYGEGNDYDLMKTFMVDSKRFFIIPSDQDCYDSYFQQYLISRLYAVVGMRYHSNIFSAKMSTPFISVSYEQKMEGFMKKIGLSQYCIRLVDLSAKNLMSVFGELEASYGKYKAYLESKHNEMKKKSYKTTEIVKELIDDMKK